MLRGLNCLIRHVNILSDLDMNQNIHSNDIDIYLGYSFFSRMSVRTHNLKIKEVVEK